MVESDLRRPGEILAVCDLEGNGTPRGDEVIQPVAEHELVDEHEHVHRDEEERHVRTNARGIVILERKHCQSVSCAASARPRCSVEWNCSESGLSTRYQGRANASDNPSRSMASSVCANTCGVPHAMLANSAGAGFLNPMR